MNRPPTNVMLMGHPVIAVPMMLVGAIGLAASLYGGGGLFPALMCLAVAVTALRANEQANKYKVWKAEWDAMSPDGAAPRALTLGRCLAATAVAVLFIMLVGRPDLFAYVAGYAAGWIVSQPWALAAIACLVLLIAVGTIIRWRRFYPTRAKPAKPVAVIARPILPVPSLADAYRALPDYCHALIARQS